MDNIPIPAPTLQPTKFEGISNKAEVDEQESTKEPVEPQKLAAKTTHSGSSAVLDDSLDDVLSNLGPLDTSMMNSKENISKSNDSLASDVPLSTSTAITTTISNPINIEAFFKDVQRYERIVNSLATKTLNGTTPLEIKWKELHDLLVWNVLE